MSIERIRTFGITPDPRWPPPRSVIVLTTEVASTNPGGELAEYRYRIIDAASPISFVGGRRDIFRGPVIVSSGGSVVRHRTRLAWRPGSQRRNFILQIGVSVRGEDGRTRSKTSSVRIQQ